MFVSVHSFVRGRRQLYMYSGWRAVVEMKQIAALIIDSLFPARTIAVAALPMVKSTNINRCIVASAIANE